ncbi:hypothetical protein KY326_03890 [Candidatus Woesearchaeota archaeon]|nr:hypothetical protein [Candidatus Woesearchaeota archaeon]
MADEEKREQMNRLVNQSNFLNVKSSQVEKDIDTFMDRFDAENRNLQRKMSELKQKIDSTSKNIEDTKEHMKAVIKEMQSLASTGDLQILKTKLEKWNPSDLITISEFIKQMEEDL